MSKTIVPWLQENLVCLNVQPFVLTLSKPNIIQNSSDFSVFSKLIRFRFPLEMVKKHS